MPKRAERALTAKAVENLKAPKSNKIEVPDGLVPGLALRVLYCRVQIHKIAGNVMRYLPFIALIFVVHSTEQPLIAQDNVFEILKVGGKHLFHFAFHPVDRPCPERNSCNCFWMREPATWATSLLPFEPTLKKKVWLPNLLLSGVF